MTRILSLILATITIFATPILGFFFFLKPSLGVGAVFTASTFLLIGSIWLFRRNKPVENKTLEAQHEETKTFLSELNREHSYAPLAIVAVLMLVHLVLVFTKNISLQPTVAELYKVGGGFGHESIHGNYWRFVTPMFLHGSFAHLISNLIGLWAAGRLLSYLVGWRNFLAIYFIGGLVGSLASAAMNPSIVSVGASGAIFSIYGALIAGLFFSQRLKLEQAPRSVFIGAAIQASNSLVQGFSHQGIDNAAHVGGLLSGFALLSVWYLNKNKVQHRIATFGASTAVIAVIAVGVVPKIVEPSSINPLTLEASFNRTIGVIAAVEKLEIEFNKKMKTQESEQAKVSWVRDQFIPSYQAHLDELTQLIKLPELQGNQALRDISGAVAESGVKCLPLFNALTSVLRTPAQTGLQFDNQLLEKTKLTCAEAMKARAEVVEAVRKGKR